MARNEMSTEQLPSYNPSNEKTMSPIDEKSNSLAKSDCNHTTSQTPAIDAALNQFPSIRAGLLNLSAALASIASEKECTKCATDSATVSITTMARDVKMAKKNDDLNWSKEEKKALKKEVKGLGKNMKGVWKENKKGLEK